MFQSIGDKVQNDLLNAAFVDNGGQRAIDRTFQLDAPSLCGRVLQGHRVGHDGPQIARFEIDRQITRSQFSDVQQIIDQCTEPPRILGSHLQQFLTQGRIVLGQASKQQFERPFDCRHWRAQFMAHNGHDIFFGLLGFDARRHIVRAHQN